MAIRTVTRAGVGLVVGIIILGLLVLGGLWLVRERGEQARRTEAINIAEQQLKEESNDGVALNTNEDSPAKPGDAATKPQGSTTIPQGGVSTAQPQVASELPQTGPELVSFVTIGLLSFAVASFVRSRKLASNQL